MKIMLYLCGMENINKFLDEYVGGNFRFLRMHGDKKGYWYNVVSEKNVKVMFFRVAREDNRRITIFRIPELCYVVSSFCNLTEDGSMRAIRDWFGDKLGLVKGYDLLNYIKIPTDGGSLRSEESPAPL